MMALLQAVTTGVRTVRSEWGVPPAQKIAALIQGADTDTEAVVHLISHHLAKGMTPQDAVAAALKRIEGAFALAILFAGHNDLMIGARRGSPLAIFFPAVCSCMWYHGHP